MDLLFLISSIILTIISFKNVIARSKRINKEGTATLTKVQELGRDMGKKLYALYYDVSADQMDDFQLIVTPSKKIPSNSTTTIYFEENDPKNNYYIKKMGKFDYRYKFPVLLTIITIMLLVGYIKKLI